MYGLHPSGVTRPMIDLHPAMSVHARITDVRTVPMSEGVSYGMNYRSPGSVKICTVPVGYADGLRRGLSGRTDVILKGAALPSGGQHLHDQCMFEVDLRVYGSRRRLDPMIGDEVLLVGREGGFRRSPSTTWRTRWHHQLRAGPAGSACACRACTVVGRGFA